MELKLPAQAGEHLVRVLRLERGQPLVLFNGDGREYQAELIQLAKQAVVARIISEGTAVNRESPLELTLAQGIARGEKMDMILQKATELGVRHIVPLITSRTEVKLDVERSGRRMAHWRAIIAGACEQSGRAHLPSLAEPLRLPEWAAQLDLIQPDCAWPWIRTAGSRLGNCPTCLPPFWLSARKAGCPIRT
jgi:16S rRNA (uracil1498-N3)-methyltransferase